MQIRISKENEKKKSEMFVESYFVESGRLQKVLWIFYTLFCIIMWSNA